MYWCHGRGTWHAMVSACVVVEASSETYHYMRLMDVCVRVMVILY